MFDLSSTSTFFTKYVLVYLNFLVLKCLFRYSTIYAGNSHLNCSSWLVMQSKVTLFLFRTFFFPSFFIFSRHRCLRYISNRAKKWNKISFSYFANCAQRTQICFLSSWFPRCLDVYFLTMKSLDLMVLQTCFEPTEKWRESNDKI